MYPLSQIDALKLTDDFKPTEEQLNAIFNLNRYDHSSVDPEFSAKMQDICTVHRSQSEWEQLKAASTTNNNTRTSVSDTEKTIQFHLPKIDFTPAKLITLLFTNLGVLTPAAVSDELIRLYQ